MHCNMCHASKEKHSRPTDTDCLAIETLFQGQRLNKKSACLGSLPLSRCWKDWSSINLKHSRFCWPMWLVTLAWMELLVHFWNGLYHVFVYFQCKICALLKIPPRCHWASQHLQNETSTALVCNTSNNKVETSVWDKMCSRKNSQFSNFFAFSLSASRLTIHWGVIDDASDTVKWIIWTQNPKNWTHHK